MRILAAFAVLAFAAACQTPCPAPAPSVRHAVLECDDGSTLNVTFTTSPDSAQVAQEGYTTVALPARIIGSGYRYADNGVELRKRGAETFWSRPGAAETICREVQH